MIDFRDNMLNRLDALNKWLGDVYGEGTGFDTLLLDSGFSEAEIEKIKREHLSELLQAILDLLASYIDLPNESRNRLMVLHYGLHDGKPLTFQAVGQIEGIAGERIRQLVNRRLDLYRDPNRQAQFQYDFASIARRLLDNESRK